MSLADMLLHMVADMVTGMVADMGFDMVADKEVAKWLVTGVG